MKNVISVDSKGHVHYWLPQDDGSWACNCGEIRESEIDTILKEHREWMRGIRTDHLIGASHKETKQALHSLLISKLPEKRKDTRGNTQNPDNSKYLTKTATGYNSAIDDIKAVLAELFGVGDE